MRACLICCAWGNEPSCEVWCQDDADCPAPWLVCGTPAVCLPLE